MSLSVCIISKDEEKNISRCLDSIKNIADEIIVVDTGSTDDTVKIAKRYGAKIFYHKWNKDFSKARNKTLEHATKDWILFLDCDEELPEEDGLKLVELLKNNSQYEGYYLRLVNIIQGANTGDAIVFRVFKNNPEYRFRGKLHEQVVNAIEERKQNVIGSTDIKIIHYGYDPNIADQLVKAKRNIELLLSYDENDKDGYYYYALGNEYTRISDMEYALEAFNKSLKISKITANNIPIYYSYLMSSIIKLFHINNKFADELKYLSSFKHTLPDFRDLYFFECLVYIEQSKFSLAKNDLYKFINCTTSTYAYPVTNFECDYDINSILQQLEGGSINYNYDKNLLSVLVFVNGYTLSLIDTIKSVNEIANEVILIIPDDINIPYKEFENYGAKILKTKCNSINEYYGKAFEICIGKYIMIMELGEICPFESQKNIVNLFSAEDEDYGGYFIYLADKNMQITSKSLRLFKNTKKLADINYANFLMQNNKVKDINACLYQSYEISNPHESTYIYKESNKKELSESNFNNSITVCIIAKDEQKNISQCLSSISHIADEIIVVDTGSTDNTAEIAKYYGAKVYYHKFENNFAKARNIALDNATKNWILQLDCDEELDFIDSFKLKDLLSDSKHEGYCLELTNVINNQKSLSLPALRVFRNKNEYRFEGRIHEQIQTSIKEYGGDNVVDVTNLKFYHYGYDSNYANIENKIERNLSILESVPQDEKDGFYYYNLGNEYSRINSLEKSLECYLNAVDKEDDIGYSLYLPIYIVNTFYHLKNYEKGVEYGDKFLYQYSTYKDLYFIVAACLYKLKNIIKCKNYLKKYIEHSQFEYGYPDFHFSSTANLDSLMEIIKNYK